MDATRSIEVNPHSQDGKVGDYTLCPPSPLTCSHVLCSYFSRYLSLKHEVKVEQFTLKVDNLIVLGLIAVKFESFPMFKTKAEIALA